jgi:hypothetical protein
MSTGPVATAGFMLAAGKLQPGDNTIVVSYQGSGGASQASAMVTVSAN